MNSVKVNTPIPGPRTLELNRRREAAVPRGVSQNYPVYVSEAEGALLEDVDGNVFIDFTGGIGVVNAGHRAPLVVEAVKRQADHFLHTCFQVVAYESFIKLAEQLNELTPGTFAKKTFFVNSGAEAVENAVKIACCHTKRSSVICFQDAFHGRTSLTMALTGKPKPYKAGFGPFPGNVYRIPFANCYRCSYGRKCGNCDLVCAEALEDTFVRQVAAESVAAVLVEPVQGEGGLSFRPEDFCRVCRKSAGVTGSFSSSMSRRPALRAPERCSRRNAWE